MLLEDKILAGFDYRNTPSPATFKDGDKVNRMLNNVTEHRGALKMLKNFREVGLSDDYIATQIQVLTDTGWKCLSEVTVKTTHHDNR